MTRGCTGESMVRCWRCLSLLALTMATAGCERVIEIVVHIQAPQPVKTAVVREVLAEVQLEQREIEVPSQISGWRFGLRGSFPSSGSYQVNAEFYDARRCLLAVGETEKLDLQTVGLLGARLDLNAVPPGIARANPFCTVPEAVGVLTGEVVSASGRSGGLKGPSDICWDPACDTLFISDTQNHRVLGYSHLPDDLSAWRDRSPTFVIGRSSAADFSVGPQYPDAPAETTLNSPRGLYCGDGILMVADTGNNRVLVFAPPPSLDCQDGTLLPVGVIGQNDFKHGDPNKKAGGPLANTLSAPTAVFWSRQRDRLLIADQNNHRVLGFPFASVEESAGLSGLNATAVWGQIAMITWESGSGDAGLTYPRWAIEYDGRILISDTGNARVLIYDATKTNSGGRAVQADFVLGQSTFAGTTGGPGLNQLSGPMGLRLGPEQVFLADQENHRVLMFPRIVLQNYAKSSPVALSVPMVAAGSQREPAPASVAVMVKGQREVLLIADEKQDVIVALDRTIM